MHTHTGTHIPTQCTAQMHTHIHTRTAYMHTHIYVHLYFYLLENANTKGIIIDCFLIGIARCTVDGSIVGAHVHD